MLPPVSPSPQFPCPGWPRLKAHAPASACFQHFMGIDFGKKRLGIAVGNRLDPQLHAKASRKGDAPCLQAVTDLVREWNHRHW